MTTKKEKPEKKEPEKEYGVIFPQIVRIEFKTIKQWWKKLFKKDSEPPHAQCGEL